VILSWLQRYLEWPQRGPKWLRKAVRRANDLSWSVVYRLMPRHQYHIIRTDLKPAYYDIDAIMEAALIKLLRRYVEDEMGGLIQLHAYLVGIRASWEEDLTDVRPQIETTEKVIELYEWFTRGEPEMEARKADLLNQWRDANKDVPRTRKVEVGPNNAVVHQIVRPPHQKPLYEQAMAISAEIDLRRDAAILEIVKLRKSLWT